MQSHITIIALCIATLWHQVTTAQSSSSNQPFPTVTVTNGSIVGTTTSLPAATASVNKFLGIPFAQTPPQRFSPAQPANAFNGTLIAQALSPACIQQFNYPEATRNFTQAVFNFPPPPGESEDCLYLNVFAPSTPPPAQGRAVMFWIYGGGFQFGSASLAAYDGSAFASYNDVVVVTHNYRTNVFGFPGALALPQAERNLGLLDQRLALQWVQENIAAFGGDPSKVTIFGESAGSFSVDAHVTSYSTQNAPFRAAIFESGQVSFIGAMPLGTSNDANFQRLAQLLNCSGDALTCLRAQPASSLKNTAEQNILGFPPVIDNYTLVANRAARRIAGNFAQVPTLIGTNADEGRIFAVGQTNLSAYVQATIGSVNSSIASQVTQAFAPNATYSDYDQISQIITLLTFQCGSAYLANQNSRLNIPTWRYLFNASFPNISPLNGLLRAYHSAEIPFVFQTYPGGPVNPVFPFTNNIQPFYLPPTAQEYALGQYMSAAWATFAKNPLLGPGWWQVGVEAGGGLGVLGGTTGKVAGVEIVHNNAVDSSCEVFRPLFEMTSGVSLPAFQ